MPNNNVFEDQENQMPANFRRQTSSKLRDISTLSLKQRTYLAPVNNNNKRVVLGALNNNVRIQPTRAAKQCVGYESGLPQVNDENAFCTGKQKTFSGQSFEILSDSNTTAGSSASTSTSSLIAEDSTSTRSRLSKKCTKKLPKEKESVLPEDDLLTTVSRLHRDASTSSNTSVMDISICEDDGMVTESPAKAPREEVLSTREGDLYDVTEYGEEIYTYLREAEVVHKPRPSYMVKQTDITYSMRWILVDWLVEVSEEYLLHTETLCLAVSYIDRFLSHMSVKRDKLQLVGTTAMFIAAKYEEIYPPDVNQFAYITNNTYKISQILRMENLILKVLSFDMAVPSCHLFVNLFAKMNKSGEETVNLALFLAELSMLDGDPFLRYLPSLIAASAVALANHTQEHPSWPQEMVDSTRYSLEDLKECYINLKRAFNRVKEPATHAIRDKYKASKYHSVSSLSPRCGYPWDVGVV